MVKIRSANELILNSLDFYRTAQPNLDTKAGSVARDLLIDGPNTQLARLYEELARSSTQQSLRLSVGADLDKYAANFGATRDKGSKATGPVLFTFNSLDADFSIVKGNTVSAKNGSTFVVLNSVSISSINLTKYKAVATKYKADLDFLGITDPYAVEVVCEASAPGPQGNISKYSVTVTSQDSINNVTNVSPFGGGKQAEDDNTFRNRILSIFSGANTGTALGYRESAKEDPAVIDSIVIEPGDTLMTRDGTQVSVAEDGTRTIISEGTGGKVDVIVYGSRLQESSDSFIYKDKSNTGDPTNTANDYVLGQISGDENKTVTRKRIDNLESEILPSQPINNIVSVSGSLSGPNFSEKSTDSLGRVTGNYELIKDSGAYAGSPWGFDRLRWISNKITDFTEDKSKGTFNGQDSLNYTDVVEIKKIQQNITVTNENSKVSSTDKTSLQLSHYPVTSVTRVFNVTSGERYTVTSQNPDGTGAINETGRITISGKSLPAISDVLQVDYTWLYYFDPYLDFDNKTTNSNPRAVSDSIDWGFSNAVRRETATLTTSGSYLSASVTHNINSVISVNVFEEEVGTVGTSSGIFTVTTSVSVENVISVIRNSDNAELYNTNENDGSFNAFTIYLPTDTVANFGDSVTVFYNSEDVFNTDSQGTFNGTSISISPSTTATAGTVVECNYLADVNTLLPSVTISNLPAIRNYNTFTTNTSSSIGVQPTTHLFSGSSIIKNLRQAPTPLGLNIVGNISSGVITVTGTTISYVEDVVMTVSANGLKQDISNAIRTFLELSSKTSIPSNVKIVKLNKVEKVTANSSNDVLSSDFTFDIKGYSIKDNSYFKDESVLDSSLKSTEITLPTTSNNASNTLSIGDKIRLRFHISTDSDSENVMFSKSGLLYTNKKFLIVDTIAVSSGFTSSSSSSATLTVTNLNQPAAKTRYRTYYDYTAPKTNERITTTYNYDRMVGDVTLNIENRRPVTADVLVKSATPILVNVTMDIVVSDDFINSSNIVAQNVQDAVTAALNARSLNTTVDSSDLVNTAYTISGVDRVRISYFNVNGNSGSVLSIEAEKNEYIVANTVTINVETR